MSTIAIHLQLTLKRAWEVIGEKEGQRPVIGMGATRYARVCIEVCRQRWIANDP